MSNYKLEKLKRRLEQSDLEDLSNMHLKLQKKIPDYEGNELKELKDKITLVQNEWERRREDEFPEYYPMFGLEKGLLSVMGYKVGIEGLKPEVRRSILADLIEGPIPLVGNPEYMDRWGKDNSSERVRMVTGSLYAFSQNRDPVTHQQAIRDWEEDLEWVKKNYL